MPNNSLKHRSGLRPPLDAQSSACLCICFANFRTNQLHFVRRLAMRYAWYWNKRFVGFRVVEIVFLVCAAPAAV